MYVDRFTLKEYGLVLAVLVLSVIDTVFTVRHLELGIDEANPIMRWALVVGGTVLFAAVKLGMTSLALIFLLVHVRFRLTQALLLATFVLYVGVFLIHVRLCQLTAPF